MMAHNRLLVCSLLVLKFTATFGLKVTDNASENTDTIDVVDRYRIFIC